MINQKLQEELVREAEVIKNILKSYGETNMLSLAIDLKSCEYVSFFITNDNDEYIVKYTDFGDPESESEE